MTAGEPAWSAAVDAPSVVKQLGGRGCRPSLYQPGRFNGSGCERTAADTVRAVFRRTLAALTFIVLVAACSSEGDSTSEASSLSADRKTTASSAQSHAAATAAELVDAFDEAGLEVGSPRPMTRDDYGIAPMKAVEAIKIGLPSLCDDCGGRVLRFDTAEDLADTKAYYDELGRESAALFSHTFTRGLLLIQLNGELPDAEAAAYNDVLQGL